jgi:uncharacterized protein
MSRRDNASAAPLLNALHVIAARLSMLLRHSTTPFDLLRQVAGDLIIPDAVYDDIVIRGAGKPGAEEVLQAAWIHRRSVQNRMLVDHLPDKLHLGEREALALAQELGMVLLIDEREARRAAEQQHIVHFGSLRILEEAKQRGLIPAVKPVLDDLIPTTPLSLALRFSAFTMREIGLVIAPLDPRHKSEALFNRICMQGQHDLE